MTVDEFKKVLASGHIYNWFYHFTARANLPSISQHGLVSKRYANDTGITISMHGGNEWSHDADIYKGLDIYVNLCFTKSHPMCHVAQQKGRLQNPIYLSIDPNVLYIPGAKMTLDVANKCGVELLDIEEGLDSIDIEVLYKRTNWNDPEIQQRLQEVEKYEILIPNLIPVNLIKTPI